MEPLDYLKSIAHRWKLVLAVLLVAVAAAWLTAPQAPAPAAAPRPASTSYRASASLLQTDGKSGLGIPFVKMFATQGQVPRMVAESLGEDPEAGSQLASQITMSENVEAAVLTFTAVAPEPERAEALANGFADAVVQFLVDRAESDRTTRLEALEAQYGDAAKAAAVAAKAAEKSPDDTLLRLERQVTQGALENLAFQIIELRQQVSPAVGLEVIERAVATPVQPGGAGPTVTATGSTRLLLAAGAGLALGCVLALALARLDTRPRSRQDVQDAYGLPVLAEVPALPATRRRAMGIEVTEHPEGAVADGYRTLRSALMLLEPSPMGGIQRSPVQGKADGPRQVLLVTSAREGEGKTSTAVNLAAALSEVGKQVLVIDCDLRNPQCHRYLDVPLGSGVTDLVGPGLEHLARQTRVPNVRLVQAGTGDGGHALLAVQMPDNVEQARQMADVVIIDAPPVLAGNEALDVMAAVDAVLVVARSGRPSADQVHRARDMIARMGTPVYGLALLRRGDGLLPALPGRPWGRRGSARSDGARRGRHRSADETGISVL